MEGGQPFLGLAPFHRALRFVRLRGSGTDGPDPDGPWTILTGQNAQRAHSRPLPISYALCFGRAPSTSRIEKLE